MKVRTTTDVFRAISDPTRRQMLDRLALGDLPVSSLSDSFEMSPPAISQHLKILREAGLVRDKRDGRQRIYTLVPGPLKEISDWVEHYEKFWRTRLGRLRKHLENNS